MIKPSAAVSVVEQFIIADYYDNLPAMSTIISLACPWIFRVRVQPMAEQQLQTSKQSKPGDNFIYSYR